MEKSKQTKGVFFRLSPEDLKTLKKITADRETSLQQFMTDSLAFYIANIYKKYNQDPT